MLIRMRKIKTCQLTPTDTSHCVDEVAMFQRGEIRSRMDRIGPSEEVASGRIGAWTITCILRQISFTTKT